MMCKAAPFKKLTCTIDTGTAAILLVSGSHQLGRLLLPSIMSSTSAFASLKVTAVDVNAMVSVENYELSFS